MAAEVMRIAVKERPLRAYVRSSERLFRLSKARSTRSTASSRGRDWRYRFLKPEPEKPDVLNDHRPPLRPD